MEVTFLEKYRNKKSLLKICEENDKKLFGEILETKDEYEIDEEYKINYSEIIKMIQEIPEEHVILKEQILKKMEDYDIGQLLNKDYENMKYYEAGVEDGIRTALNCLKGNIEGLYNRVD